MSQTKKDMPYEAAYFPGDWVRPRLNSGDWVPLLETAEIFNGHRVADRHGVYNIYDEPVGIRPTIEEGLKSEPFLKAEMEWEGKGQLEVASVWKTDSQYHMVYDAYPTGYPPQTCYATSDDGYNWNRAELSHVEFSGSKYNNIIGNSPGGGHLDDPNSIPQERFKSMTEEPYWFDPDTKKEVSADESERRWADEEYQGPSYSGPKVELRGRLIGWTSSDRLRWKRIATPLGGFPSDGGGAPQYDDETNTYFAYLRVHGLPPAEPVGIGTGHPEVGIVRRAIGLTKTKDFRHWPAPKLVLHPDAEDPLDISFYGCNYFRYPGRADLHGMFVEVYHQITDEVDIQIAFSRDGLLWYRPERRPIVPLGTSDSGESCMVYPSDSGIIELPDGYWALAYAGMSVLHNDVNEGRKDQWPLPGQISWSRWKPHRFCGIEADAEGHFTVPTIQRKNNQLHLNYRCKRGGWIKVELLHRIPSRMHPDVEPIDGRTFEECDTLTGDSLNQIVTWQNDSAISGTGDTVAIRIKMFKSKIFAYQV